MNELPENIAKNTDHLEGLANIRAINKAFRMQDESHLYPIFNKFNATERAIRKARKFAQQYGALYGLEYCLLLDSFISEIVNDPKNF